MAVLIILRQTQMLRRLTLSAHHFKFANTPSRKTPPQPPSQLKSVQQTNYGSLSSIAQQRKKLSIEARKKYMQSQQLSTQLKAQQQFQICEVTLYMKHDEWKSQYIYLLMNYQQMGFTRMSDYIFLRDMEMFLKLDKKPEGQRWPVVKFKVPLRQNQFRIGIKDICDYIDKNHLFLFDVVDNDNLAPSVQKYINDNIVPHLDSLFWHPRLTFQQVFHTNLSSFSRINMNYKIIRVFFRNFYLVFINIIKNLIKIIRNREIYDKSKQNLQKGLREVIKLLNGKQYMGGEIPSHLDFYLFAVLNTKITSTHYVQFLKTQISEQFWDWFFRMKRITRYENQRLTLI